MAEGARVITSWPRPSLHICSFAGCSKTFSRQDRLKIHLRSHTGEKPFCCEEENCTKKYARASHLKRHHEKCHLKVASPSKVRCKEAGCGEFFSSHTVLKKHIMRMHESRPYKCLHSGCGKAFRKHQHLKVHEFEHTRINPFVCPAEGCTMSFRLPSLLKRHSKVHEGYLCDEEGCNEKFETWTLLRKHKHKLHQYRRKSTADTEDNNHTTFSCEECGRTFNKPRFLRRHMKTHSSQRPLYCCPRDGCQRSYLEPRNLYAHVRSFHDGHKFTCDECQKQFTTKQRLNHHRRTHHPSYHEPEPKPRSNSHRRKSKLERLTGYKREQTKVSETATSELMESHSESCHAGQEVKEESVLANDGTGLGTILRTNDISTRMDTTVTPSGTDISCPQDLDPSVPSSASQTSDSTYPCKSSPMASSAVCASQEGQGVQHKCR
ncbi:transcription factor IIIA-like [Crassostrea virginica]|uniref:Transcription factor IIIA-like n=1 Tax=Crassostrea virginica TaxID=6565 RepID=A0A8B8B0E0_CRAVI|nr:transcription factor IIIA-like [Crassostrea virginica]